jgi:GntR family transcriptional regulator/MocR family aminotransferase
MVVPQHLKAPLEIMLKHSHRFVAPSIQFVLNQFIEKKYLHNHVLNLIETVSERAGFFKQNFTSIFQGTPLQLIENETLSLQTLIQVNEGIKEEEILKILTQNNISAHSLHKCYLTPSKQQGLIMGHCSIPKPIIKNKLNRMRNILDNCIFAP